MEEKKEYYIPLTFKRYFLQMWVATHYYYLIKSPLFYKYRQMLLFELSKLNKSLCDKKNSDTKKIIEDKLDYNKACFEDILKNKKKDFTDIIVDIYQKVKNQLVNSIFENDEVILDFINKVFKTSDDNKAKDFIVPKQYIEIITGTPFRIFINDWYYVIECAKHNDDIEWMDNYSRFIDYAETLTNIRLYPSLNKLKIIKEEIFDGWKFDLEEFLKETPYFDVSQETKNLFKEEFPKLLRVFGNEEGMTFKGYIQKLIHEKINPNYELA